MLGKFLCCSVSGLAFAWLFSVMFSLVFAAFGPGDQLFAGLVGFACLFLGLACLVLAGPGRRRGTAS